jgi:7,8-dihydropterin-6-yl-methyl-4-(beta-D-ribofuranosyl)aminobenzene 5'-phosphate synthase
MKKAPLWMWPFLVLMAWTHDAGGQSNDIKVTVLYDNTVHREGLKGDWGYSCLIEGTEKTILFDAGTQSEIFYHNLETLKVDPTTVDIVAISHEHGDHTGAMAKLLERNSGIPVYYPTSFSNDFVRSVRESGGKPVPVLEPVEICKDVFSTGEMGTEIKEHALILKTSEGLVLMTGCSHPGIVEMLEKTKTILDEDIYMVFGGFHLMRHSEGAVREIITRFKEFGVKKCGATHCTGESQIEMFRKAYGDDFVSMGAGKVLTFKSPR